MNKKQLVNKIASTMGQSKADAERMFDTITQIILDCLKSDEPVKIAGFGTYKVAKKEKLELVETLERANKSKLVLLKKLSFYPLKA